MGRSTRCIAWLVAVALLGGCDSEAPLESDDQHSGIPLKVAGSSLFDEVAGAVGLGFSHFVGATGEYYFPEMAAAGVAVLDYDGDGDLDVYLLQGELPHEIAAYRDMLPVFLTSVTEQAGLEELRAALADSRTVLAGHSGVGKSSLLNALEPELRLETAALRAGARKGRHTTTHAVWLRLPGKAVVVDTPGVREIATGPVAPELLDEVYPDIARLAPDCRFRDCRHEREPDCAVLAAIERRELHPGRLLSFGRLRDEIRPR